MAKGSLRNLNGEELEKVRGLLEKLDQNHFPSKEEMEALRDIITSDDFKTLIERERNSKLWAKVRLQFYKTIGAILGTVVLFGSAFQALQWLWDRLAK